MAIATSVRLATINSCVLSAYLIVFSSIGNLLGEKNANRAGVAANAAMLLTISVALFLRSAPCFLIDFLYMMVVLKWRPSDLPSNVGIHVQ